MSRKNFSSGPEVEKTLVSRSSPLSVSAHRLRSKGFALQACLPFLWVSSFGDDDANRVLADRASGNWSWSVNHGSIGGSVAYRYFWLSEEA